eukprot:7383807-Prymnesium_polylepis.1
MLEPMAILGIERHALGTERHVLGAERQQNRAQRGKTAAPNAPTAAVSEGFEPLAAHRGRREPARRDVVREDGHRVLLPLVLDKVKGLGQIAHDDARGRDDVDWSGERRRHAAPSARRGAAGPLELALAQELLLAHVVDAQAVADAREQTAREGRHRVGHVLHLPCEETGSPQS